MKHSKLITWTGPLALLLALAACDLGGVPPKPTLTPEPVNTKPAIAASPSSAPTLSPTPTENLAPTPLPAPTQIQPPTAAPTDAAATGAAQQSAGPVLSMNPAVGEPGDTIIVNGTGWPANAHVVLSWGPTKGPTGPKYWELDADANGSFNVGLKVPAADKWPGGPPTDRTLFQLRATSDATAPNYYWANFTYIKRFVPPTKGSPVGPSATPKPTSTPTP